MQIEIRSPQTPEEFEQYYNLRWALLRKPWKQPPGSEKDELEDHAIHRVAISDNRIVGVARLHKIDDNISQIRYMAVTTGFKNQGIGTALIKSIESAAKEISAKTIILHAREQAVKFYQENGYQVLSKSHLLYDEIQHYKMHKELR